MTDKHPGEVLRAACDDAVAAPELRPEYAATGGTSPIRTFCNLGARRIAQAMGCKDFDAQDLNADAMHDIMARSWGKVAAQAAVMHALDGGLAFASMTGSQLGSAHGHLAALRPEAMQASGSLGRDVPMLANIGVGDPDAPLIASGRAGIKTKRNWNCKASQAFPMKAKGDPDFFIWRLNG